MPQILINQSPQPVWSELAGIETISFVNQDLVDTITVGQTAGITPGDTTADAILPPGASINLPGATTYYAVTDAEDNPTLQVTPGAANWSGSPQDIAEMIVASGLALSIAEAIAGTGISLLGSPQLLYSIQGGTGSGSATGLVGLTVPNQALNGTCYYGGLSQTVADTNAVQAVQRGLAGNHPSVTKKFWNISDWSTTKNNMQAYSAQGTVVYACLRPVITHGLPTGSDFTTTGTTAQKNAAIADKASLASWLNAMKAAPFNFTAANMVVVLEQEPANADKNNSATDYGNMWKTYGPTINAAGLPICMSVNYAQSSINSATDYINAGLGLAGFAATGTTFTEASMDYYTNHYFDSPQTLLDPVANLCDANGLKFSVIEFGANYSPASPVPKGHFSQADCTTYFNYITTFMSNRQQAGKPGNVIYYEGQCDADGNGDITNPILSTSDFRSGLYATMFDTLTTSPGGTTTLAHNHTTRLSPLNPSPTAGFGSANYMGYEFSIGLSAGVAATNPHCIVILNFYDFDVGGNQQIPIENVQYSLPMGTNADPNGPTIIYGHGPMRGAFVDIKISNLDSVDGALTSFQFVGTSRLDDRHVWTWDISSSPQVPITPTGYQGLAQAGKGSLQIGRIAGATLPPGVTKSWLFGIHPGQVFVRIAAQGLTADNVNVKVQPQPTSIYGTQNLINESVGSGQGEFTATVALPRSPVLFSAVNNDPTNTATVSLEAIAIET